MINAGVKVSVILSTLGKREWLGGCLESLTAQTLDKKSYEIVIVVNQSVRSFININNLEKYMSRYRSHNLILIHESKPGLAHARNRGIKTARGEYLAFIDDDARAEKNWLKKAINCFRMVSPSPLVLGGPIKPFYEGEKPIWFKDVYETRFWGDKGRFLKKGESFSGSNMIFRKEVFTKYGRFDEELGMKKEVISVGEETSLFEKIWQNDEKSPFYYLPSLIVYHLVPDYKMTVSYQLKRSYAAGMALFVRKRKTALAIRLIRTMAFLLAVMVWSLIAVVRIPRYRYYQNWLVEEFQLIAYSIGYVSISLGFSYFFKQRQ